jgi:hypothetical protein
MRPIFFTLINFIIQNRMLSTEASYIPVAGLALAGAAVGFFAGQRISACPPSGRLMILEKNAEEKVEQLKTHDIAEYRKKFGFSTS